MYILKVCQNSSQIQYLQKRQIKQTNTFFFPKNILQTKCHTFLYCTFLLNWSEKILDIMEGLWLQLPTSVKCFTVKHNIALNSHITRVTKITTFYSIHVKYHSFLGLRQLGIPNSRAIPPDRLSVVKWLEPQCIWTEASTMLSVREHCQPITTQPMPQ